MAMTKNLTAVLQGSDVQAYKHLMYREEHIFFIDYEN